MFDLDADPRGIEQALSACSTLRPLVRRRPGLRIPGGWDGFEIAVRAVISHRMRAMAAHALMTRLTQRFGARLTIAPAPGLDQLFPTPGALADADLVSVGLTPAGAHTVRTIAQAMVDGRVDFNPDRTLEDFVARWTALPGIGASTAHYLALRALGHPDAFPINDLTLFGTNAPNGVRLGARRVFAAAEAWRPWRGYAAIHLWRHAGAA
jgi:AraC family transcriptional regulator of adaptative response / DNA-3-methyladenine glycosylase II